MGRALPPRPFAPHPRRRSPHGVSCSWSTRGNALSIADEHWAIGYAGYRRRRARMSCELRCASHRKIHMLVRMHVHAACPGYVELSYVLLFLYLSHELCRLTSDVCSRVDCRDCDVSSILFLVRSFSFTHHTRDTRVATIEHRHPHVKVNAHRHSRAIMSFTVRLYGCGLDDTTYMISLRVFF